MKGELRLHEIIFLAILVILDVYLLNLNISVDDYEVSRTNKSRANYMKIEELIDNNSSNEVSIMDHYEIIKGELEEIAELTNCLAACTALFQAFRTEETISFPLAVTIDTKLFQPF